MHYACVRYEIIKNIHLLTLYNITVNIYAYITKVRLWIMGCSRINIKHLTVLQLRNHGDAQKSNAAVFKLWSVDPRRSVVHMQAKKCNVTKT